MLHVTSASFPFTLGQRFARLGAPISSLYTDRRGVVVDVDQAIAAIGMTKSSARNFSDFIGDCMPHLTRPQIGREAAHRPLSRTKSDPRSQPMVVELITDLARRRRREPHFAHHPAGLESDHR